MLKRACAAVLVVLGLSPVTAPFATSDLADILHGQCASDCTAALHAPPAIKPGTDAEALVVPTLTTRPELVRVALVLTMGDMDHATTSRITLDPAVTARGPIDDRVVHRILPRTPSVLRV